MLNSVTMKSGAGRLVAIVGIGGMGKSSLAITFAQRVVPQFEFVVFRTLQNGPPLAELLDQTIRMVSDQQVAEDLLQEAFVSVWRRAASYSPQAGAVRSWLVSIMHHRTIDYLRSVAGRMACAQRKNSSAQI